VCWGDRIGGTALCWVRGGEEEDVYVVRPGGVYLEAAADVVVERKAAGVIRNTLLK
jgi:hypothetical protein